jgi:hypothetical protein
MSMDSLDCEREQALEDMYNELGPEWARDHADELYAEHYEQAVKDFTTDRLQSYFLGHAEMAKDAVVMMETATQLKEQQHAIPALIFATSAAEITIKHLLVKPILNGLVHNEAVADVVMGLTPTQTGSEAFKGLLFGILKKVASIDLATHRRRTSSITLWDEWKQLQKARNNLVHDGVQPPEAILAIFEPVAVEFLNVIFPAVVKNLGLDLTGYLLIVPAGQQH